MSTSMGSISLRGVGEDSKDLKPGSSSAILLKLDDNVLRDLKKASSTPTGISFLTGSTPVRPLQLLGVACSECRNSNFE